MKYKFLITIISIFIFIPKGFANEPDKEIDWFYVLGFNMGGTAPVPLPAEVRKINNYNPKLNPQIGVNIIYNVDSKWGVGSGLTLDRKGTRVKDEVKYMYTSVVSSDATNGDDKLEGYFVGKNKTNVGLTYMTLPLYMTYNINNRWQVRLGGYASLALSRKFEGSVWDGYMRIAEPTGQKQEISHATFNFNDDIRKVDLGALTGAEFKLNKRIGFYGNFTWAFTPIFKSDINPIKFTMRNIYGTVGITYRH